MDAERKDDHSMTEQSDRQKEEQPEACGPGCCCGSLRADGRWQWIAGVVILLIAAALVARALVKSNGTRAASGAAGFAELATPAVPAEEIPATEPAVVGSIKELASLSDLNTVAPDTVGVFVFVPGKSETNATAPISQMQSAARTIEPQLRGKVGMFTLRADSSDYAQIAAQMAVPGVLAMLKGGGMSATSGDITETKIIQAFAAASSAGGCGPGSAGCGLSGCK